MKYTYAYKTSDGVRHEASMNAESREAVFAALREKGIKAIKVVAADGSKANGEIRGVRKRMVVLAVIIAALAAGLATYFRTSRTVDASQAFQTSRMRRQVIGDAAVIDKGIRTGWDSVFELEGERFLASFAIPGRTPAIGHVTEEKFREALSAPQRMDAPDGAMALEARQIIAMVEGVKDEARRFLEKGGSVAQYCRLLRRRQEEEIGYFNRAKVEIDKAFEDAMTKRELEELWEKRNDSLRALGISPVPYPAQN